MKVIQHSKSCGGDTTAQITVAFNIFWLRIGLSMSFDVFLKAVSFLIRHGLDSSTFTIALILWLKQHFTS
jgi:hypothetical protein